MRASQNAERENYIKAIFACEDAALGEIMYSLREDEAHMQISPVEGKILHTIVKMSGATKIVEIGVLGGYSSVWMAQALPNSGKIYALEMDYKKEHRIRANFAKCNVTEKIELIIGKALQTLPCIEVHGPFDMVFIDADKANYLHYLAWAEKNVRKGGMIVGDNSLLFGAVYGHNSKNIPTKTVKTMQEFNLRLANTEKYTSIILPTNDGMTIAVKNF